MCIAVESRQVDGPAVQVEAEMGSTFLYRDRAVVEPPEEASTSVGGE